MAYHIFEVNPFRQMTHLQSVATYKEAKDAVKNYRTAADVVTGTTFRMMFANDPESALRLLQEKRKPRPMGEHD